MAIIKRGAKRIINLSKKGIEEKRKEEREREIRKRIRKLIES